MSDFSEKNNWMLPFASTILAGGAIWYVWARLDNRSSWPDPYWYGWIQLAFIAVMGILCLWATFLFISGKSSGWSMFKTGLSMIPLVLFLNLVVLIFRVVQSIMQGNAISLWERLSAQPQKLLLILIVLVALGLLGALKEKDTRA